MKIRKSRINIICLIFLVITNLIITVNAVDNQIPSITITYPNEGEIVSGVIIIYGSAYDEDGIVQNVYLKFDEGKGSTANGTTNWSFIWDTTQVNNGLHTIYARSHDGYNYSNILELNIIVENIVNHDNQIPNVNITSPIEGETIMGPINISGNADDYDGAINKVEIRINEGSWERAKGSNNWIYSWDTTKFNNGLYSIFARSYDGEEYSNIDLVKVVVDNFIDDENQIPTVMFTHPLSGDNVSGLKKIYGKSYDTDGTVLNVQICIDSGEWLNVTGTDIWNYTWNTNEVNNGGHIIYARCFDGYNFSEIESIIINVNNESTPSFEILLLIIAISLLAINKKMRR